MPSWKAGQIKSGGKRKIFQGIKVDNVTQEQISIINLNFYVIQYQKHLF
jgi:hypothetical protein